MQPAHSVGCVAAQHSVHILTVSSGRCRAAAAFHFNGHQDVAYISDAYQLLSPALGNTAAKVVFGIALLASGQNSTITGTLAGEVPPKRTAVLATVAAQHASAECRIWGMPCRPCLLADTGMLVDAHSAASAFITTLVWATSAADIAQLRGFSLVRLLTFLVLPWRLQARW